MMCHIFLALPVLALPLFFFLPLETALPIYLIILFVSGFLYYKIGAAMQAKVKTGKEEMIGEEAVVIKDINPEGKVTVWSEIWSATGNAKGKQFRKGEKVKICDFYGLTAVVCEAAPIPLGRGGALSGHLSDISCHSLKIDEGDPSWSAKIFRRFRHQFRHSSVNILRP
jgi:membrane protein implicated in regulation of membrane protease activity